MKKILSSFSGIILLLSSFAQMQQPVDFADPLLGTSESRWMLNPGATMPFGMVQLSSDNQGGVWKSGYEYSLNNIGGFSHIHSWIMAGLSVMPTVGVLNSRRSPLNLMGRNSFNTRLDEGFEKSATKVPPRQTKDKCSGAASREMRLHPCRQTLKIKMITAQLQ